MDRRLPRGFTLIEVLVAIFILGLMLVGFVVLVQNLPLIRFSKDQDLALKIADNKLESVRAGGYDAVPTTGSFSDALLSSLPSGAGTLTTGDFNAKAKTVTVTVSWKEPTASSTTSVSLSTLIAETGGL